jgi:uncharacterized membrane protein
LRLTIGWTSLIERLRTSLWMVPVGYSAAGILLALALVRLDERRSRDSSAWFLYGGQADGARELLSTIASSMLTIAGLVFSITILVLQLASSQFSPRVLRTFLADRITQRAMGMFLGSFVYAMMLLPQVRSETDSSPAFVPSLAVFVAFGLVLLSVGMFVQYIHHMAHSIRAVNILARVARETHKSLTRLYPDELLEEPSADPPLPEASPDLVLVNEGEGRVVVGVDELALMDAAQSEQLVIAVVPRVGDFVPHGAPLVRVWGEGQDAQRTAREWIALAHERTPYQDPIFGFRQLVDVAVRALSPGVNDPTTASQALDHIHDLLRYLCRQEIPCAARLDESGTLRLHLPRPAFRDYVQLSFEEIRIYGASSVQVVRRARGALLDLITLCNSERAALLRDELARLDDAVRRELPGFA